MLKIVHLLTGAAALLLSFVPSLRTVDAAPYLQQPDALYLALFGLLNLILAPVIPHWNKGRLEELYGADYMHLSSLGNLNYKSGGSIAIANYALGRQSLEIIASRLKKPMVLMCACRSLDTCHRTLVASMLRADGFAVEELTPARITELLAQPTPAPPHQSAQGPPQRLVKQR